MIKITERSIYPEIIGFLKQKLNAIGVTEVGIGKGFADIVFKLNSVHFIVEIKIGGEKEFRQAMAQVFEYAESYGTKNVIILVYPKEWHNQTILDESQFSDLVLNEKKVLGWIHTDYWTEWVDKTDVSNILLELERRVRDNDIKIDFNSVVNAIRENVSSLYEVVRQAKTKEIFEEVAEKLELFAGLGEIKDHKTAESQVTMLASYLLFNQLFFYHVYKVKNKNSSLSELKPIHNLDGLRTYFKKITKIDYKSIYDVNLIDKLPDKIEVIQIINDTIKNLVLIKVEYITNDLAGRFFHTLLPREVAKVWAAFYTNPTAAEILANLAIDNWDDEILDPACGSGTLLAAGYRRKLNLAKERVKLTLEELHERFLEQDITGMDIMPFAAHLTTINLSLQKLECPTNIVRVARTDSILEFGSKSVLNEGFRSDGILLKPLTESIQQTLAGEKKILGRKGTISQSGKGNGFYLKPVDVVIMNPPFSDREKLPKEYRAKLNKSELGKICGHQVNLWGYFLALADLLLKPNGKIAAVIPINIARGQATEKIREYLLKNYHIIYIIKPIGDPAFSESAALKDVLFLAEKRLPNAKDVTTIIYLNKSIKKLSTYEATKICDAIKRNEAIEGIIQVRTVAQAELTQNKENLMVFLAGIFMRNVEIIREFKDYITIKAQNKIKRLESEFLNEGFAPRPRGLSKILFLTRKLEEERIKQALLIVDTEENGVIRFYPKHSQKLYTIEKEDTLPAFRTITSVRKIDISKMHDYILLDNFDVINEIVPYLNKIRKKHELVLDSIDKTATKYLTNMAIPIRFRLNSDNTSLTCFYSSEPIVPTNAFFLYTYPKLNDEDYKILTLFLNSILYLSEFYLFTKETTGGFFEIKGTDLSLMSVLNLDKLSKNDRDKLLKLFDLIKDESFPSITKQLGSRFGSREKLDRTVLEILGLSDKKTNIWLPKVYSALSEELHAMKTIENEAK